MAAALRNPLAAGLTALVAACATDPYRTAPIVPAALETPPVGAAGDAADDPAIWVAPDSAQTRIIGTQKQGGLYVYDLAGRVVQELPGGRPNNIDVRDGFAWPEGPAPIVAASDRADNSIAVWRLDPVAAQLAPTARARIATGFAEVYGACLGAGGDGAALAAATSTAGDVGLWRLAAGPEGVAARRIMSFSLGAIAEGCVVDEAHNALFVAEEGRGIWRIALDDAEGAQKTLIAAVGDGPLAADVEGLAIWRGAEGGGYLVASAQGRSRFVVYQRSAPHALVGAFRIGAGPGADAVSGTDGVDVTSAALGPEFPAGLLVAQDDENTDPAAAQNFKFVSWAAIAAVLGLP